ncbi:MAG: dTDP-4-amino-4,6-dideoxygalactose transaminase [Hydrogenovibrio sp.]|uniref:dTDP-4-amino-4,6-dideoxygalactose transaminase n=1 Tax=Hydrogenovibrio sp. TaxID=2065821 RepID=UPI0028708DCC|nr:dTDP-4-amino-4,6-dideoxygalactose transaminase [Hydrogenovibrio sp.]MDR9498511.1 dTDP-4-amino-4,6-dideoxygalactose transaminase [Hydrogenovibrio sp.]MDR9499259.1 dTDP-4-amino-4,6-dideoxygalactose transaminase [Hydrogenovibrio sp.]
MITFNKPPLTGNEQQYVLQAMQSNKISGDGFFGKKCQAWFEENLGCAKTLLTPSCTAALEMAAILVGIQPGDEVIMPSYTFVSTANAFVLRGAKIVFVDIRPDTMNIDETLIESAITLNTKAIVPVHYAGVACEMDAIMDIANRHGLFVVEDAAQGMMSQYKGKPLGTIGHLGAFSFHETKNYTSGGEGGLLIINDERFLQRAEVIREKGTNRSQFFRGQVDKYTWVDVGSSYLPSELQAAFLWGQLENADEINQNRLATWNAYHQAFKQLQTDLVDLPIIPDHCQHNAHMYYLKLKNLEQRTAFIEHLKANDILAVFHYIPLHTAPAGQKFGEFHGSDQYTTSESERLVRLPKYFGMNEEERYKVIEAVKVFLHK